ncbi:MAG TPA: SDR family NAD(P)-dependent oxidoreductase [Acidimicrobiia bacterium]|nr:SDR family NAD(P)-dependent oxidoreductase [Acidimicrobiia bacterium]
MRSVLVTGSSSGFGLEISVALASRGWRVFASMRDPDRRSALDAALATAGVDGDAVEVVQLDVTDGASITKGAGYVLEATGGALDAVVHNAGVSAGAVFEETPDEECRRVMETNFFGVLALTREVLPAMRAQRSGRLVLISSDSAFIGTPGMSVYCASKWALEGWGESLAMEVAPFGIGVVLVEPGAYKTEIWDKSPRYLPGDSPYAEMAAAVSAKAEELSERFARDPKEVAEAVVKALDARRPRFRYAVGPDAKAMGAARGVMPFGARAWVVRRVLGLPRA